MYLLCASLDDVGCEVRQLLEEGVLAPHGLGEHLGQLHGSEGRRQPAITAQHIHTRLDQTNGLREKSNNTQHTEIHIILGVGKILHYIQKSK